MNEKQELTITKKISKMGDNNIIVLPKALKNILSSGDLIEVKITVLEKNKENKKKTKESKPTDKKILALVNGLIDKGYNYTNVEKVLVENGYNKKEVKKAIQSHKNN